MTIEKVLQLFFRSSCCYCYCPFWMNTINHKMSWQRLFYKIFFPFLHVVSFLYRKFLSAHLLPPYTLLSHTHSIAFSRFPSTFHTLFHVKWIGNRDLIRTLCEILMTRRKKKENGKRGERSTTKTKLKWKQIEREKLSSLIKTCDEGWTILIKYKTEDDLYFAYFIYNT